MFILDYIDIIFFLLGCYFIIRGFFRGIVNEVVTLVGFVAAFYISFRLSGAGGELLAAHTGLEGYVAQAAAGVIIWFAVMLAVAAVRMLLQKIIGVTSLGGADRVMGFLSGFVKTAIVVYSVMAAGMVLAPVVNPTWMAECETFRLFGRGWPAVRSLFVGLNLLPEAAIALPDQTLEDFLRPYLPQEDEGHKIDNKEELKREAL